MFITVLLVCHVAWGGCTMLASNNVQTEAKCLADIVEAQAQTPEGAYFKAECFKVPTADYKLTPDDVEVLKSRLSPGRTPLPGA